MKYESHPNLMSSKSAKVEPRSDQQLVEASCAGEREAFVEIVRRYQPLVCAVAYAGTMDFAASEDVAQETFVAAWKTLPNLREPGKLKPWLTSMARIKACDWQRTRLRKSATPEGEEAERADPMAAPDETLARADAAGLIDRALHEVPASAREALILYYREGRSIASVAQALELSEDAVKQRLSRGREALRERLMGAAEEFFQRTQPGAVFTFSVMAAVGALTSPSAFAANAVSAGGGHSATATTSSFGSGILMNATQLTVASLVAFLVPVLWPTRTAPSAPSEASANPRPTPVLARETRPVTSDGTQSGERTSRQKDPRITRLGALLDEVQGSSDDVRRLLAEMEARQLIHSLPLEMLPAAYQEALSRRKEQSAPLLSEVFSRWGTLDPAAAYAAAIAIPKLDESERERPFSGLTYSCVNALAESWARNDQQAAFAFFSALPRDHDLRYNTLSHLHDFLALAAPEDAMKQAPDYDPAALNSLIMWARHDPDAAWNWVTQSPLPDDPEARESQEKKRAMFVQQTAYAHPAKACEFALQLPGKDRPHVLSRALEMLATQDPVAAVERLKGLRPEDRGEHSLGALAWNMSRAAPLELADALPDFTDSADRESLTSKVAPELAELDIQRALSLALGITDQTLRGSTLFETIRRWLSFDETSARAYIDSSPDLTPDQKQKLAQEKP